MASSWSPRHSVVSSGGVTVTSINSGPAPKECVQIETAAKDSSETSRCSVVVATTSFSQPMSPQPKSEPHDSGESDNEELKKLDLSKANVVLRDKAGLGNISPKQEPRPMSWEGELSDSEMKQEVDEISMDEINPHDGVKLKFTSDPPCDRDIKQAPDSPLLLNKYLSSSNFSPIMPRMNSNKCPGFPPNPSPDSAIHSCYSPTQSPVTSRHALSSSGLSSPSLFTPSSLSRNNSDASQYGGSQNSSNYSQSYSSQVSSPTHSPLQGRHFYKVQQNSGGNLPGFSIRNFDEKLSEDFNSSFGSARSGDERQGEDSSSIEEQKYLEDKLSALSSAQTGISRQQLINSPCPICGDKISGFHYGIFSCESCKGFFKRTVQNRKNYICLRGSSCLISISTRKKCPACRFNKCLNMGMKLEAIREDRTRGGRSTYQCSYTLPAGITNALNPDTVTVKQEPQEPLISISTRKKCPACRFNKCLNMGMKLEAIREDRTRGGRSTYQCSYTLPAGITNALNTDTVTVKQEPQEPLSPPSNNTASCFIPPLLQEIMEVEHLWQYSYSTHPDEVTKNLYHNPTNNTSTSTTSTSSQASPSSSSTSTPNPPSSSSAATSPDFLSNLCNIADNRLYKIVKWCKSLPLFKHISIDDQISLLINSWCELLLFSCCYRSINLPSNEIKISLGKVITLNQAKQLGLSSCIERMLNFKTNLKRLKMDKYEYVTMKVIILLTISDSNELKEPEKVRIAQEKALQALQSYTLSNYPNIPSKFGELLLRIPDLQRTCQIGKEMLSMKHHKGEDINEPSFNLLMELLRGDH
ncbi:nuclear hormone receptor FTZ-F1 beta [Diaphorina citri]|uniref:Nuclear hormone receptor FTZ-F1 beta n=1 Tax=Diaphorina citri TaxID=121845 RepID=A0A3Q0JBM0_DIACI|nr:nuclear hormone receptor FTZ-F1 beta [Diaphorina citri]